MRASRSPRRVITRQYFWVARTRESEGARSMRSLQRGLFHPSISTPTWISVSMSPRSKSSSPSSRAALGVSPRISAGGGVSLGRWALR